MNALLFAALRARIPTQGAGRQNLYETVSCRSWFAGVRFRHMQHKTVVDKVFQTFLEKLLADKVLSQKGQGKLEALLAARELRPELIKVALFAEDDVQ